MDIEVQESMDNINYFPVYDFQRATAVGVFRAPLLTMSAPWVRYVETVAGTTPSFTIQINRLVSTAPGGRIRQSIDRTNLVLNTLNSATPAVQAYDISVAGAGALSVNIVGVAFTTAPVVTIQGSDDGSNWSAISTPVTLTAGNNAITTSLPPYSLIRLAVTTAGTGATYTYAVVKIGG
jgi:hypothetical protein